MNSLTKHWGSTRFTWSFRGLIFRWINYFWSPTSRGSLKCSEKSSCVSNQISQSISRLLRSFEPMSSILARMCQFERMSNSEKILKKDSLSFSDQIAHVVREILGRFRLVGPSLVNPRNSEVIQSIQKSEKILETLWKCLRWSSLGHYRMLVSC